MSSCPDPWVFLEVKEIILFAPRTFLENSIISSNDSGNSAFSWFEVSENFDAIWEGRNEREGNGSCKSGRWTVLPSTNFESLIDRIDEAPSTLFAHARFALEQKLASEVNESSLLDTIIPKK
ncbi:hypothetical protein LIER_39892 [Lithospermum erythrorhizon]|uniref:Uncharacterized protein n=1 Tax=Lithospermum erythrorhizon TaxID=34254 RepID=A0AAV3QLS2_LITER